MFRILPFLALLIFTSLTFVVQALQLKGKSIHYGCRNFVTPKVAHCKATTSRDSEVKNEKIRRKRPMDESFERWSNPKYDPLILNKQFVSVEKSLLTIGSKGVAPSQINSLVELLKQHERVIVKLASDKIDPMMTSKQFTDNEEISKSAELLQVRKRGILFGRKQ